MGNENKFDAIIVGAGVAGSVTGYLLAEAGLEVLVVERGNFAGAKNMTGGRLYGNCLERIMPGFTAEAPLERKVINEKISMLTPDSSVTMDYKSARLGQPSQDSYTVLRSDFDRWLADKAEEAGAIVATGILVDSLLVREGKVCGIVTGGEEMEAEVVVLADGVNSLLAEQIGMKKPVEPSQVAVGVKEVIEISEEIIQERFNVDQNEGVSWLFAGSVTDGCTGGGFLYTNKKSISLGLVLTLSELEKTDKTIPQMMEDFKKNPLLAPLIKDGKIVEYSAHLVPEAGYNMLPKLFDDGVLIVGDAAGLVINTGYMVRGMDLAIASGEYAAKAIISAKEKKDFSAEKLSVYKEMLEDSFVLKDMKLYEKVPAFMENPRIFNDYPEMLANLMADMFIMDGTPSQPLLKKVWKHAKEVGIFNLVKDAWKGGRAL
ncbi:MAG TPA: FAD-dependent oxidoreductase [Syntrophomonadaceae bacterium]|nr:FAD-dependent oxidoreductase [Syntrophomonadaceae bacterium]